MTSRRQLLIACGTSLAALSLHVAAQPRQFRVAYLSAQAASSSAGTFFQVLKNRLRELGHVEGTNISFDSRWADGKAGLLPALAAELVALKPDVLVTSATLATRAAQQATASIPIVMAPVANPVGAGLVKSLARPGGNITGVASLQVDISAKSVELLHSLVPRAQRIGILTMPLNPAHTEQLAEVTQGASRLKLTAIPLRAANGAEIDQAFVTAKREKLDALVVFAEPLFGVERHRLVKLAAASRLPVMYQSSDSVDAGGLISYGANVDELFRMAAGYVDKILRGAKPANLPVEQPTRLELVVNAKAARALGLSIPQSILLRANRVIE